MMVGTMVDVMMEGRKGESAGEGFDVIQQTLKVPVLSCGQVKHPMEVQTKQSGFVVDHELRSPHKHGLLQSGHRWTVGVRSGGNLPCIRSQS